MSKLTRYQPQDAAPYDPAPWAPAANQGPIDAWFTRMRANRASRTMNALVPVVQAHEELTTRHTALVESQYKDFRAQYQLWEAPEKEAHELEVRRIQRHEVIRKERHIFEINETKRATEMAQAQTVRTHAMTALEDAEQQLQAQRDHGYLTYELIHRKRQIEMLDLELSQAERRKLLRMQDDGPRQSRQTTDYSNASDDTIDEALNFYRQQLNGSGHDTSLIDEAIRNRRRR